MAHPAGSPVLPRRPARAGDRVHALPVGEVREIELPQLLSEVYRTSSPTLRARLLECLLRPLRPLGLVAVAAGAFGSFLHRERWGSLSVPVEEVARYSAEQVYELARYVEQFQPEALAPVAALMADSPTGVAGLSGALLMAALRLRAQARN